MLNPIFSPEAEEDILSLRKYLFSQYEEESFFSVLQKIEITISLLSQFPKIGTTYKDENIRKIPVPKTQLVLIFRSSKNTLEIIRIYHSSQGWDNKSYS